tara:strand:- start:41 stop:601 length:561 start_codon:yes stop_codon:yes gene_type:complete
MTQITNEVLNNTSNDYNIFILLKRNMVQGEIRISNLSSKNRSLLHRICANYGLEHFSTGNYSDRVIIIKDTSHSYFSVYNKETELPFMHNIKKVDNKCNEQIENNIKENLEEEELEEEELEEEEELYDEEELEEEADTDTYSSSSSKCSSSSNSQITYYKVLKEFSTIRTLTVVNLFLNIAILYNL